MGVITYLGALHPAAQVAMVVGGFIAPLAAIYLRGKVALALEQERTRRHRQTISTVPPRCRSSVLRAQAIVESSYPSMSRGPLLRQPPDKAAPAASQRA